MSSTNIPACTLATSSATNGEENTVPVFLDINALVTEHLAVLAMTGSGKSYTVGRIIERLVAINNGTVVVFDPHGEYGKALARGNLQFSNSLEDTDDPRDRKTLPEIKKMFERLQSAGVGISVYTPQHGIVQAQVCQQESTLGP